MTAYFDPNDQSYYHTGCCDTHVTKAAWYVAITSVVSLVLRTSIMVYFNGRVMTMYNWMFSGADLICILLLLAGVYSEIRHLLLPHLLIQIFGAAKIMYVTGLQLSGEREMNYSDGNTPTKGIRMAIFIMRILWIVLIVYFFKIILNFFLFLKRRESAERKFGPQGIPPILPYRPQYPDEYPPPQVQYQAQPPAAQYQEYPPQDHLVRYQEYPPQDHLQQRYQEYPPQDHLTISRYQEYPPQDHLVRYQEYPPQDHLVANEPPPPYLKRHSYVSIEGDQTMVHQGQYQHPNQNQAMCQQHPYQPASKPKYQPSGCGMIVAAMGANGSLGGFGGGF